MHILLTDETVFGEVDQKAQDTSHKFFRSTVGEKTRNIFCEKLGGFCMSKLHLASQTQVTEFTVKVDRCEGKPIELPILKKFV